MQFGIFSIGDITPDPTTGRVPTEHERIKSTVAIARKAEEVGLDVFAIGQHHNPRSWLRPIRRSSWRTSLPRLSVFCSPPPLRSSLRRTRCASLRITPMSSTSVTVGSI